MYLISARFEHSSSNRLFTQPGSSPVTTAAWRCEGCPHAWSRVELLDSADEGCRHRQTASPASWLPKGLREFTDDLVSPAAYFRARQREEAEVPMVVLLMPIAAGAPSLDPDALRRLAELGITNLALVRDEDAVGLVLEGWAFDPNQSGRAALDALVDTRIEARTLRPITQLAVSAVSNDREGR